jgi:hypothetical protein
MDDKKLINRPNTPEIENEIQDIIKDIAINMKEIKDLSDKALEYANNFRKAIIELKKMNKRCKEIEDHVKNVFGRAILLSNYKYSGENID